MWFIKQAAITVVAVLVLWLIFACLIRSRSQQPWSVAMGKAFLIALQTGVGVGLALFCCLDVESPTHKNYSLSSSTGAS